MLEKKYFNIYIYYINKSYIVVLYKEGQRKQQMCQLMRWKMCCPNVDDQHPNWVTKKAVNEKPTNPGPTETQK